MVLGNQEIDAEILQENVSAFVSLNNAVKEGGDLLFYGCELAKDEEGDDFLSIIKNNTHLDVAASNNLTGNNAAGGDWELEVQKGDIEAIPLKESIALKDFTGVLQFNGTIGFDQIVSGYTGSLGGSASINSRFYESASANYTLEVDGIFSEPTATANAY